MTEEATFLKLKRVPFDELLIRLRSTWVNEEYSGPAWHAMLVECGWELDEYYAALNNMLGGFRAHTAK